MITWYLSCRSYILAIRDKAVDALHHCENEDEKAAKITAGYMRTDFENLQRNWRTRFPDETFGNLLRHIAFGEAGDFNDIINNDLPPIEKKLDQLLIEFSKKIPTEKTSLYVSLDRIKEIEALDCVKFSTRKLISLLRELNIAYANDAAFSVGILVRSIIDHVPPIFGCSSFNEVVNNYKGTKSFKGAMVRLNDSLRNLADSYLHVQVRKIESLPTMHQVEFRAELDALLSEVSRLLQ